MPNWTRIVFAFVAVLVAATLLCDGALAKKRRKKQKEKSEDPYAQYVWPPPPDTPRIKLEAVIRGRIDVEASSKFRKILLGASPQSPYDTLRKPFAVAFDDQERILVTDTGNSALIRFDLEKRRMDVFGTKGAVRLKTPLGLHVGRGGTIYVADAGLKQVVAFDEKGTVEAVFGSTGELQNPTDAVLSPDGSRLLVADSKAHRIIVFDPVTGQVATQIGGPGGGDGEFNHPTSLAIGPEGNLFVVDQINSRVQVFGLDGEYLDGFGGLGVGFARFVRPKDVAVDEAGFIYVTDNAFNNLQLFDADFSLLTFVGAGGSGPGRFHGASGVAVRGDRIAVVDQLGRRVQLFRFIVPKDQ